MHTRQTFLAVFAVAIASCSSPPESSVLRSEVRPMQNNRDWCRVVGNSLGDFTCSPLPGERVLGQYKTFKAYDKNLVACTPNHGLDDLGFSSHPAQVAQYSEDWNSHYSGTNGLDLSSVLSWLPDAKVTSEKNQTIKIDVVVEGATIRSISDIAMRFNSHKAKGRVDVESCCRFLCSEGSDVIYEVLSGDPIVTLSARDKFDVKTQVGWKKVVGLSNNGGFDGGYSIRLVKEATEDGEKRHVVLAYKLTAPKGDLEKLGLCRKTR